jgi:hypothetical protein
VTAAVAGARTWTPGEQLPPLVIDRVDRTTLALFAGGSGDHNPMAFLGRLLTDNFPQTQLRSFQTRFTALTPVNAQLFCLAEVVFVDEDLITLELRVELSDGTTTLTGTAVLSLTDVEGT